MIKNMFSNKEQITFTKVIILVFAIFMLTLSSVMATYYDCTKTVQTGCGYSKSTCSGKYLKCVGYYDSSSEKYFVMNYIDGPSKSLSGSDGCYAGKRNASISIYAKGYSSYSGCKHTHSYTKNLI
ncbi:MAG: hypothetical protein HFF36_04205 [Coprobacillus sp.]|nr:hypothetical protein [Coprobacillus sp.]